jgi:putative sterol carrier protein
MNDEVRAFFEDVARRGYDARLRGASGTCEFDFDDDGSWRVLNADGWVTVDEGRGEADCYVAGSVDDFLAMARGEQRNPWALALRGGLRFNGDYIVGQAVARVLYQR